MRIYCLDYPLNVLISWIHNWAYATGFAHICFACLCVCAHDTFFRFMYLIVFNMVCYYLIVFTTVITFLLHYLLFVVFRICLHLVLLLLLLLLLYNYSTLPATCVIPCLCILYSISCILYSISCIEFPDPVLLYPVFNSCFLVYWLVPAWLLYMRCYI